MDYTTLTGDKSTAGSIASYLNNSQVQASVPAFIEEAEAFIYRGLRHWRMLSAPTAGTMTTVSDQIAIPADFLDPYAFYITASAEVLGYGPQAITLVTPEQVISSYAWDGSGSRFTGTPRRYYFNGSYLQLDTVPDLAYPYALIYYQQPAALSADNTTNWLTQFYPRLLRAAIMAHAVEWTKESGSGQFDRTYWMTIAAAELARAQQESDTAKRATTFGAAMSGGGVAF